MTWDDVKEHTWVRDSGSPTNGDKYYIIKKLDINTFFVIDIDHYTVEIQDRGVQKATLFKPGEYDKQRSIEFLFNISDEILDAAISQGF